MNSIFILENERTPSICDWFVGDTNLQNADGEDVSFDLEKVSYENMIACLKHLRKSLKLWTKEGGRKGYINYISEFISAPPDEDEVAVEDLKDIKNLTEKMEQPLHKKIKDGVLSIFNKK